MSHPRKLSSTQLTMLILGFCLGSSLVLRPGSIGRSGWVAALLGTAEGIAAASLYVALSSRFHHVGFVSISRQVFGRVLGLVPVVLFVWFSLQLGGLVLANFGDYFNIAVLQATPVVWFVVPLALAAVYTTRNGPQIVARCATVLVPVAILLLILLTVFLIPSYRLGNILPIISKKDLLGIAQATHATAMFPFAETVVFLMILPCLGPAERAAKATMWGLGLAGLVLAGADVRNTAALGSALAKAVFPSHSAARLVEIGDVITRVEILVAINFLTMGFLKICVLLHAAASGVAEAVGMSSSRPMVLPAGLIMVILSVTGFRNGFAENTIFASETWPVYAPVFTVALPLITLLTALLTGKPRNTK